MRGQERLVVPSGPLFMSRPFESGFAPRIQLERETRWLTESLPSLIEASVPFRSPISARHSSQSHCPRPDHDESAMKGRAVALNGVRDQASFGGRRPTRQPYKDDADRAMMLSEDKFSEVLVVGDENLPGLGCRLQYYGVWTPVRQLGNVYCGVTQ